MQGNEYLQPDPEVARILEQRARDLAVAKGVAEGDDHGLDFVEFDIGGEYYGIELEYIREVYAPSGFTYLPGIPPFVRGIINVRGTIVSVMDLKRFFGLTGGDTGGRHVIIVSSEKMEFGILADHIVGVRKTPLSALQPPLATLAGVRAHYLKGIVDTRIALLDGHRLLEDENLRIGQKEDV